MSKIYRTFSVVPDKNTANVAILQFDIEGKLISVTFNPEASDKFKKITGERLPVYMSDLKMFEKAKCTVKDITDIDLSFEKFWDHYGYKVGNISRNKKLWNTLIDTDKILAIGFVRRYKIFAEKKGIDLCYPETYLAQRRWENILPI